MFRLSQPVSDPTSDTIYRVAVRDGNCVMLTDVWVKDDGRWQAIRRHSTPAPPGACADLKGE